MKKVLFTILLFSVVTVYAQKDKKYILRTDFGYSFSHKDMLDASSGALGYQNFGEINSAFSTSLAAGRKLKSNFYWGLGVFYNCSKDELNPDADVPDYANNGGWSEAPSYVHTTSKDHVVSPFLFFQYFYDFTDWFSISFDLYAKYDFFQNNTNSIFYMPWNNDGEFEYRNINENNTETKKQILDFGLRPALRFRLVKNFGLDFTFGILQYSLKVKDSRQDDLDKSTNEFQLGFAPNNWMLGIYLKL